VDSCAHVHQHSGNKKSGNRLWNERSLKQLFDQKRAPDLIEVRLKIAVAFKSLTPGVIELTVSE